MLKEATITALNVNSTEAAQLLGISRTKFLDHVRQGLAPAGFKIGGRRLWRRAEIIAWNEAECPPRDAWEKQRSAKA